MPIPTVTLADKQVGRVGLGLMQLTWTPTPPPEAQAFAAMKAAADAGATSWSTATFYGQPPVGDTAFANLELIGRFFKEYPEYIGKIQLVVKGGIKDMQPTNDIDINRELLKKTRELLGPSVPIDVYLPARIEPAAAADPAAYFAPFDALRQEGLFTALGASEVSANTLRTLGAAGIKISVVEIEVSLWSYEQDVKDVIAWSAETQTPVYCYSPLGRGFLTRTYKTPEDIPEGSMLQHMPRFQGDMFYHNLKLVDVLDEIAARKGLTAAQLALAWVLSLSPYTVPIPGSSNVERVVKNTESANFKLDAADLKEIHDTLAKFDTKGGRYAAGHEAILMV